MFNQVLLRPLVFLPFIKKKNIKQYMLQTIINVDIGGGPLAQKQNW